MLKLASPFSGVSAELRTDQPGVVLYSCNWSDGTAVLKSTQGIKGVNEKVGRSSCIAIEAQEWPDGINQSVAFLLFFFSSFLLFFFSSCYILCVLANE